MTRKVQRNVVRKFSNRVALVDAATTESNNNNGLRTPPHSPQRQSRPRSRTVTIEEAVDEDFYYQYDSHHPYHFCANPPLCLVLLAVLVLTGLNIWNQTSLFHPAAPLVTTSIGPNNNKKRHSGLRLPQAPRRREPLFVESSIPTKSGADPSTGGETKNQSKIVSTTTFARSALNETNSVSNNTDQTSSPVPNVKD